MKNSVDEFYSEFKWEYLDEIVEFKKLPIREDYDEIRTFQNYEFIQCAVYELALRDIKYQEEVDAVVDYYRNNQELIDYQIDLPDRILSKEEEKDSLIFYKIIRMINNIEVIAYSSEHDPKKRYKNTHFFGKDFFNLVENITNAIERRNKEAGVSIGNTKLTDSTNHYNEIAEDGFIIKCEITNNMYSYQRSKTLTELVKRSKQEEDKKISSNPNKIIYPKYY